MPIDYPITRLPDYPIPDARVHDDEILGKAYDARLMRRLLQYLRPYWRQVALAFVDHHRQRGGVAGRSRT